MSAYKIIELTRGVVTAVSREDYARVKEYCWCVQSSKKRKRSYAATYINGKNVELHRFILNLKPGDKRQADHWNDYTFDNRRYNLRICTNSENAANAKKHKNGKTSQYKGVSRHFKRSLSKPFVAQITIGGHATYLGLSKTEEEAALKYDKAARKAFGRFACLNFPKDSEMPPVPPPEIANQVIQLANMYVGRRNRKSKYVGVYRHQNRWRWQIVHAGVEHSKSGFASERLAAEARDAYITENGLPHKLNF